MVSKDKWAEIIKDFHEKNLPKVLKRDLEVNLDRDLARAISLIGPRRAGKTYEMFDIINKLGRKPELVYVNFERADLGASDAPELVKMLEVYHELYPSIRNDQVWLFLDEVQNVQDWEKFVRSCLDQQIKVFITGSSSKMLSREIATSMRGRNITYHVFPFSFNEFLRAKGFETRKYYSASEKSRLLNLFQSYLKYGGYPETVLFESEREKILMDIFNTAIYRDVIERANVRNTKVMKALISALLKSKEFSVNKFYNFLKSQGISASKNSLYNYLDHLQDAFFVFTLRKFDLSYVKTEQSIPKIYFSDNGLLSIHGIDDKGRLLENMVFIELNRRGHDIAYYKDINEEVDFVVKKGKKVLQLIQVCYDMDNFMTKDREVKALQRCSEKFRCNDLIVICHDCEERTEKGIRYVPAWKWLIL